MIKSGISWRDTSSEFCHENSTSQFVYVFFFRYRSKEIKVKDIFSFAVFLVFELFLLAHLNSNLLNIKKEKPNQLISTSIWICLAVYPHNSYSIYECEREFKVSNNNFISIAVSMGTFIFRYIYQFKIMPILRDTK